jgi:7-alpha-hydroxysteroid dehydrogenase
MVAHAWPTPGVTEGELMTGSALDRFRLDGRVALITGGGKGIGAAIAYAFADAGADCVVAARTEADVEAVAEAVRSRGRRAIAVAADVNDLGELANLVERTVSELGGIDIVVNNAGGSMSKPFLETTAADLEKSFHFNVVAAFELVRLAVPHLLARGGGVVCNIGSVAGKKAVRNSLTHSLTKAAVEQLTRLMAIELAPRIRVNGVLPGAIETDSLRRYLSALDPSIREAMHANTAMRRNGEPDDIANAVLYLCSPAAQWVTGELVTVDGMSAEELIPKQTTDL